MKTLHSLLLFAGAVGRGLLLAVGVRAATVATAGFIARLQAQSWRAPAPGRIWTARAALRTWVAVHVPTHQAAAARVRAWSAVLDRRQWRVRASARRWIATDPTRWLLLTPGYLIALPVRAWQAPIPARDNVARIPPRNWIQTT